MNRAAISSSPSSSSPSYPSWLSLASAAVLIFGLLGVPGIQGSLRAAETEQLVKLPVGPASWKIDVSPAPAAAADKSPTPVPAPASAPAGASQPVIARSIEVTQDADKQRSVIHWTNGGKREVWAIARLKVILSEDPSGKVYAGPEIPFLAVPFVSAAFTWVTSKTRVEPEPVTFKGRQCYHYKGKIKPINVIGDEETMINVEAWIDSTTFLPVALHDGTALGTYTFNTSAPEELTLPAKFQAKLNFYCTVMGAGPYRPAAKRTTAKPAAARQ